MNVNQIFNGTPHAINIISGATFNPTIRKWTGGIVVLSIPSNGMLNAEIESEELTAIEVEEYPMNYWETGETDTVRVPLFSKKATGCDPLPEGYGLYIVSALYAAAIKTVLDEDELYDIVIVSDPVMTADGQTFVGCRGFSTIF